MKIYLTFLTFALFIFGCAKDKNISYAEYTINSPELKRWERWMKIGGNKITGEKIYYGLKSYLDHNGYQYIWIMRDFPKNNTGILSSKALVKSDCKGKRFQLLGYSHHKQPMTGGLGKIYDHSRNKKWENYNDNDDRKLSPVVKILCELDERAKKNSKTSKN